MARGDEEFIEFAQASAAGLRHAAYLLTGNRDSAEEAVQATLVNGEAMEMRIGPAVRKLTPGATLEMLM